MSIKCDSCGFPNNPNGANCCGKCGKDLNPRHHFWISNGSDRYKVYDSYSYKCLPKGEYDSLKSAEKEVTQSLWKQQINLIKKFWKYSTSGFWEGLKEGWKDDDDKWGCVLPLLIIVGFIIFGIIRGCSSDSKQLTRIKVNEKYGIGYSDDKLLVPAEFDSIAARNVGNQWFLYDLNNGLVGVAYVTDSIQRVISPLYDKIDVGGDKAILKKQIDNKTQFFLTVKGQLINEEGYKSISFPGQYLSDANVLIAKDNYDKSFLLDKNGSKLYRDFSNISPTNDSVIIASDKIKTYPYSQFSLFDYDGNKLTNTIYTRIRDFSDGVTWCTLTENDARLNNWSLIDNHGNILFTKNAKYGVVKDFNDGVGWFQKTASSYAAVDKRGKELFEIDAYNVYPFTLGIAPVYKGSSYSKSKMGFVNKRGETIIPFLYRNREYGDPRFGRDSLMSVNLDGVEGKLHRNGKFVPNKK